jgi:hypothetical protein
MESGFIDPRSLDLRNRCRLVASFSPWPIYPRGKRPWYPLGRRLGGLRSQSGRCEKKNLSAVNWTPSRLTRSSSLYPLSLDYAHVTLHTEIFLVLWLWTKIPGKTSVLCARHLDWRMNMEWRTSPTCNIRNCFSFQNYKTSCEICLCCEACMKAERGHFLQS